MTGRPSTPLRCSHGWPPWAGRCISVTHEALGTVRVMKTCGMTGEVVAKAASVAIRHDTTPRGVSEKHWGELDELVKLPGSARRPRR